MKRFEGVRRRELLKIAMTIKELDITAKGEAIMLMMAVTRFMVKRSETLSKSGSGRWKHDGTSEKSSVEVSLAIIKWRDWNLLPPSFGCTKWSTVNIHKRFLPSNFVTVDVFFCLLIRRTLLSKHLLVNLIFSTWGSNGFKQLPFLKH